MNDFCCKRTLIISSNSLSTINNNGKMLSSFFKKYPSEKIAQIYSWPEFPNTDLCKNYYRITDSQMLKSWFGKGAVGEKVFSKEVQQDEQQPQIFKKSWKNKPLFRLARDIIWSKKSWKTAEFDKWLCDFNPEVIFFSGLNCKGHYEICRYVAEKFNIPIIVYITDDYFLPRFSLSPFFQIRRKMLYNNMRYLLKCCKSELLSVNEVMREKYRTFFDKESKVVYNAVNLNKFDTNYSDNNETKIVVSYIGNLSNNRDKSFAKFKKLLKEYNNKDKFIFKIYTAERPSDKILKMITYEKYIEYCGGLDSEGVIVQLHKSDVLMHAESFGYNSRMDTKLSLSTKIIEYMAASRPILIFAPPDVGSTSFIKKMTNNIIISEINKTAFCNNMDKLLDRDFRQNLGKENRCKVEEILTANNVADIMNEITEKLCDK